MQTVETPGARTIDEVSNCLQVTPAQCLKTLLVEGDDRKLVALILRGDHELNALKAEKLPGVSSPLTMASSDRIQDQLGVPAGFVGPVGLDVEQYVDHSAAHCVDFVCGANEADRHLAGVNWRRDLPEPESFDLRIIVDGDPSPGGGGPILIARGIEIGHIFQLGDKYSRSMDATILDQDGQQKFMLMGCYGIGVSRIVAAAIEQNHDDNGIIWPDPLSPYQVSLLSLNAGNSTAVSEAADSLYRACDEAGIEVLYDDRDARPGVKFADADLLGIPHRLVLGERGLDKGIVEYRHRRTGETQEIEPNGVVEFITGKFGKQP